MYTAASMGGMSYLNEQAYVDTQSMILQGEDRETTFGYLIDNFPELEAEALRDLMADVWHEVGRDMDADDVGKGWLD